MHWWSLKQLKSASARSRFAAIQKLGREGEKELVEPLSQMLADPEGKVRAAAARALVRIRIAEVVAPLADRLKIDPEAEVRSTIVKELSLWGEGGIPGLVVALADPSSEIGWQAVQALKALRWEPKNDPDRAAWYIGNTQFDAVITLGAAAIEPLVRISQGTPFQRSIRAVEALAIVGGAQVVKPLIDCLQNVDFTIRSAAVTALGEVGDGRALEPLIAALHDKQHQVSLAACIALGKVGDKRAVEPMIENLQHPAPDVRTAAVEALGKLRDRKAVPALVECLKNVDKYVREAAAAALGLICEEQSIEHLVICLTDVEATVRQAAARALIRIQPHWEQTDAALCAIPGLQAALKDKEYWVRHSAAEVLKKLGAGRTDESPLVTDSDGARRKRLKAHAILFSMLADRDRALRQAAAETLGRIGLSEAVPHLVERLIDRDRGVKTAAARSLEILRWRTDVKENKAQQLVALERWTDAAKMGDEAVDALVEVFYWNDAGARRRATETLVHIGSSKAVGALKTLAADGDEAIRTEAATALTALKPGIRQRQFSTALS